jgi:hypothetical protein
MLYSAIGFIGVEQSVNIQGQLEAALSYRSHRFGHQDKPLITLTQEETAEEVGTMLFRQVVPSGDVGRKGGEQVCDLGIEIARKATFEMPRPKLGRPTKLHLSRSP